MMTTFQFDDANWMHPGPKGAPRNAIKIGTTNQQHTTNKMCFQA